MKAIVLLFLLPFGVFGADTTVTIVSGSTSLGSPVSPTGPIVTNGHSIAHTFSNTVTFADAANAQVVISNGVIGTMKASTNTGNGQFATVTANTITVSNGFNFPAATTLVSLTNIVYTNVTLDFPSTAADTFSDLLINVANLKSNDVATINPPALSQTNGAFTIWISNTFLYARFFTYQATAINPASGIFNVTVFQFK